jgi:hypothetical protein
MNDSLFLRKMVRLFARGSLVLIALLASDMGIAAEVQPLISSIPPAEALKLGERMYREGILPSGKPTQAFTNGDTLIEGTAFSCISCHMRSGLGSYEGSVYSPPTTGRKLYLSFNGVEEPVTTEDLMMLPVWLRPSIRRIPYTDESLALALRAGVDPSGRVFGNAMPRYALSDSDTAIMIHYLKNLSGPLSPGVMPGEIRLATVVTDGVDPEDRDVMLKMLQSVIQSVNTRPDLARKGMMEAYRKRTTGAGFLPGEKDRRPRPYKLDVWNLTGPPKDWPAQLEAYYQKKPVFALVGGIGAGSWRPIHEFCERNEIPCLYPITDYPAISETDWYTRYLSKGLYQEGEAAARYLASTHEATEDLSVIQVHTDDLAGRTLAEGFRYTWEQLGRPKPPEVTVPPKFRPDPKFWSELIAAHKPRVILFWHATGDLSKLLMPSQFMEVSPRMFLSYGQLGNAVYSLPIHHRPNTYIAYPYDLGEMGIKYTSTDVAWLKNKGISSKKPDLLEKAAIIYNVLSDIFMLFDRYFYRDYLLDMASELADKSRAIPLYTRVSFGPGQLYASKGCYITQLDPQGSQALLRKSEWAIK